MIEWDETAMKKTIIIFFALLIMASLAGCHKIKRIFVKPPPEGLTQESYTIKVYAYQSSVVVKATTQEFIEYFLDFSPLEKISGIINMEFKNLDSGLDMTKPGTLLEVDIRAMGIKITCNFITIKYEPEKGVWMMIQFDGSWILMRFELKPVKEGNIISLDTLAFPSENISVIIDNMNFLEVAAKRLDLIMALFQSEFDPSLDAKELTGRGLRGELYEEFFQADDASIWISAGQEEVTEYIITNLESYFPEIKMKDKCNLKEFMNMHEGQILHCPAIFEFLNLNVNLNTFFTWVEKDKNYILRVYAPGRQNLIFIDFNISSEAGGSRVNAIIYNEIPEPGAHGVMDIMMALAAVPRRLGKALLDIKQGMEGSSII